MARRGAEVSGRGRLLLATTNPAKLARLRAMAEGFDLELLTLADVSASPRQEERGESHRAIAEAKARAWSGACGGLALATDGGLDIPALGARWEGVLTRRAAGSSATDAERAAYLLELTRELRGEARRVVWREAVALADRGRLLGAWEVESGEPMRLAESYEPVGVPDGFYVPGLLEFPRLGRRYSQLTVEERELALDHWAKLRQAVRAELARWAAGEP